jgi:hypothetical protein
LAGSRDSQVKATRAAKLTPSRRQSGQAAARGPVYATVVWIGPAGPAILGMAFFESTNFGRGCCLVPIAVGVIGLRFFSAAG